MRCSIAIAVAAMLATPVAVHAQDEQETPPDGWQVRFDRAGSSHSEVRFVDMPPGWHVTSGPAGIYYHPDSTASGDFRVASTIHLFDPNGRNREAFGVLLGGKNLDGPDQDYLYFLIRNTGDFLVKHRAGSETHTLSNWQASDAIVTFEAGQEGTATNTLAVAVNNGTATFFVNDVQVARLEANPMLNTDGVVGFRVNHGLNIHVRDLVVSK